MLALAAFAVTFAAALPAHAAGRSEDEVLGLHLTSARFDEIEIGEYYRTSETDGRSTLAESNENDWTIHATSTDDGVLLELKDVSIKKSRLYVPGGTTISVQGVCAIESNYPITVVTEGDLAIELGGTLTLDTIKGYQAIENENGGVSVTGSGTGELKLVHGSGIVAKGNIILTDRADVHLVRQEGDYTSGYGLKSDGDILIKDDASLRIEDKVHFANLTLQDRASLTVANELGTSDYTTVCSGDKILVKDSAKLSVSGYGYMDVDTLCLEGSPTFYADLSRWVAEGDFEFDLGCDCIALQKRSSLGELTQVELDELSTSAYIVKIDPVTDHAWSTEWERDDTHHWHACTNSFCTVAGDLTEMDGYGLHTFDEYVSNNDATCTEDGSETATCACGATHTRTDEGSALDHDWGSPAWSWSADGKTSTLTLTCANDATHTHVQEATVSSKVAVEPTCTEMGTTAYTATVEFEDTTYTDSIIVKDIAANGHSYANGVCTVCGEKDPDYVPPAPSRPTYRPEVGETDGGTVAVTPSYPHEGDTVTVTPEPDEGFEVGSVGVTDKNGKLVEVTDNGDGTFSFVQPAGKVTIEVTFGCDGGELCPTHPFGDVDPDAWYHDAVDWAVTNHVLNGYGDGEFMGPLNTITRVEMAQVLWNQAGRPATESDLFGFVDVDASGWYADPVAWCLSEGIFRGYGDAFGTERPISREEVATVLWRLSGEPGSSTDLSSFSDAASVSDYATDALAWAVGSGVVTGKDDGAKLDPQGVCTRAEAAAMLMRLSAE